MKRRGWFVLGGTLLALAGTAAVLLRPRAPEAFPLAELVPSDALLYAGFADIQQIAGVPGLEELAARLAPARRHLSGAAAVYLDRHGDWVFLARLTRLAALVAGGEVEQGAAIVARTPAALERHKDRRRSLLDLDTFRTLGARIFVNLDALRFHARQDFSAIGLELVAVDPPTFRGRALYRGELFRLYVEQYLQAPRRTSDVPLGGLLIEPLPRLWDDLLLSLNPLDKDRVERLATGLARDFFDGRPVRDVLAKLGGAWGVELRPGPAATLCLDLPDTDTRDRVARMLPKLTSDVVKFHRDRGEPPPYELTADGGTWRVRVPRAAELRLGAAFDPAYAFRENRLVLSTRAADLAPPGAAAGGDHLALKVDVDAALSLARDCVPVVADAAFREEAELGAASLYARAFTPETMSSLKRQFPDPAELRKFLDARRSQLRAKALEELAKTPAWAAERDRLLAEINDLGARLQRLKAVELNGRYGADGLGLELVLRPR